VIKRVRLACSTISKQATLPYQALRLPSLKPARKDYSAKDKSSTVLEGICGEEIMAALCGG
jgi:hypothetical protein